MIAGLDISNHQTSAAFDQIKAAGYWFVIHKASEGDDFVDRYLATRWARIKAAGLARGTYHFCRPSANTAKAEAAFFVSIVRSLLEIGDSVWADVEDEHFPVGANVSPWTLEFCNRVEQALGQTVGVYTYPSYVTERKLTDPRLARHPLWWASYRMDMHPAPAPWPAAAIWQYTSEGTVVGCPGRIDLNRLLGDSIDDFLALGKGGSADWTGRLRGKEHWGGDPLPVIRRGDRLYRGTDGVDLTGFTLDEWQEAAKAAGQLRIEED